MGTALATQASIILARFDEPTGVGPLDASCVEGVRFLDVGADVRAASIDPRSTLAYTLVIFGLHDSESSARELVRHRLDVAPWLAEAKECCSLVLRPFRHFGEANFLGPGGPVFEVEVSEHDKQSPLVIVTSAGWDSAEGDALERIIRFSEHVGAVRIGMGGTAGLLAQHSFGFAGGLATDGITVTFWRDVASAMAFAYGPGLHRSQVKVQREELYGDRTSFTRFAVLSSEGTWNGSPFPCA